ncbi:MAG: ureidoglycolate lyase [Lentibacter sp.]|uniref:ureidoglycolate lyase n=1 Tax=Lentibacter sp. TaxID=2024994 RepID=UPI00260AB366|nr:ureidoglycolate lyase [Lentibacter sp.]MDG1289307.1 ureidoglycolate lyase [Lentibacter sp.]
MSVLLTLEPLTREAFAPYGDVIEVSGEPDKLINQGMCGRFHDLAKLDFGSGRAGISLFDAQARHFPYSLDMMERHPEGSQAFIPLSGVPMIISVAKDNSGKPGQPRAFLSEPQQSINIHRNTWHGVLAPVEREGQYIVIDRIGDTPNLEEYYFQDSYIVNV